MANKKKYCANDSLQATLGIPEKVMNYIYHATKKMMGRSNLGKNDYESIIQELTTEVWRTMNQQWDEQKFVNGNMYLIRRVNWTVAKIYRKRIKQKLDTPWIPIEECHTDDDDDKVIILPVDDNFDRKILFFDVRIVVNSLPDELRLICEYIMKGYSFRKIAKLLNIPEPTIRIWRMKDIREFFIKNGIKF